VQVLMLGWEFPPYISGGLGTACHGLTRALIRLKTQILFVLPMAARTERFNRPSAEERPSRRQETGGLMTFMPVACPVRSPYVLAGWAQKNAGQSLVPDAPVAEGRVSGEPLLRIVGTGAAGGYEGNLILRITEYADRCVQMTLEEEFDVVHAHDWVTFPAGLAIAAQSGRPFVAHVHSTEFDRSGEGVNQAIYDIEREGMHGAASVIAVSQRTKGIIVSRYGVSPEKVRVVHNGIEPNSSSDPSPRRNHGQKVVLFLGRLTMQKGPEYFVQAAKRVLSKFDNVKFVIAGWGDLGPKVIEQVVAMGLGRKVQFTGFIRGKEVEGAYRMADVYVMPSVSEPFGLTALEAIQHGVPVVLSKDSGVAEVLSNGALKCDFWDVDGMADQILALLNHPELAEALRRSGAEEIRALTWDAAAQKCVQVYWEATNVLNGAVAG